MDVGIRCKRKLRFVVKILPHGGVAKWLCSGLQSRLRRFDPDPRLQTIDGPVLRELAHLLFRSLLIRRQPTPRAIWVHAGTHADPPAAFYSSQSNPAAHLAIFPRQKEKPPDPALYRQVHRSHCGWAPFIFRPLQDVRPVSRQTCRSACYKTDQGLRWCRREPRQSSTCSARR